MTIRETSIGGYYKAIYNGVIEGNRRKVLTVLLEMDRERHADESKRAPALGFYTRAMQGEGLTSKEVGARIQGYERSGRFTELRAMGLIYENGTKKCTKSGNTVIAWMPTWNIEIKPLPKKETKDQIIARLESELVELRAYYKRGEDAVDAFAVREGLEELVGRLKGELAEARGNSICAVCGQTRMAI